MYNAKVEVKVYGIALLERRELKVEAKEDATPEQIKEDLIKAFTQKYKQDFNHVDVQVTSLSKELLESTEPVTQPTPELPLKTNGKKPKKEKK